MSGYIVIEGVIGVGKTTLTKFLSKDFNAQQYYEIVEDNPFLSHFYLDKQKFAFDTEIFFLLARFRQQRELEYSLQKKEKMLVCDYLFDKNKIFAQINLSAEDFRIFSLVFYGIHSKIISPNLVIYLRSDVSTLMKRIQDRDRPFERNMDEKYIATLCRQYDAFFETYKASDILVIDTTNLDFVARPQDYQAIKEQITKKINIYKGEPSSSAKATEDRQDDMMRI
ncbi:MAG: deoxynucleoside kinase [Deltaproteobacteria bacterium]|nr:deoxynucleoside kinase [Deltaproteobacteria bacterium]